MHDSMSKRCEANPPRVFCYGKSMNERQKRGEEGQRKAKEEKVRSKEAREKERRQEDHRFFLSSPPSSARLFEMLQKITGSGMKGCTVGGQEREEKNDREGEEEETNKG